MTLARRSLLKNGVGLAMGVGALGVEGLAGAAQARQARPGERELIVDDEDDGDHDPLDCSTAPQMQRGAAEGSATPRR